MKKAEGRSSPVMMIREHERKKTNKVHHKMKAIYHIENERQNPDPSRCFNCDKAHEVELYDIKLMYILEFYEENPKYNSGQTLFQIFKGKFRADTSESDFPRDSRIPNVMYKLYPLLKYEKYVQLKEDKEHMEYLVHVCEDCYLRFTEILINNKGILKAQEKQRQHIQELIKEKDPSLLKNRMAKIFGQPKKPEEDHSALLNTPSLKKANKSSQSSATLNQSSARARNIKVRSKGTTNELLERERKKQELKTGLSIFSSFITNHVTYSEEKANGSKEQDTNKSTQAAIKSERNKIFSNFREEKGSKSQIVDSKSKRSMHNTLKSGKIKIYDTKEPNGAILTHNRAEGNEDDPSNSKTLLEHDPTRRTFADIQNTDNIKNTRRELGILSPTAAVSTEESNFNEGYNSDINLKLLQREIKPLSTTNADRTRAGDIASFIFRGADQKGTTRDFRILSRTTRLSKKSQPEQLHRNNYSGIVSTINDLRSFLANNSLELEN